MINIKRRGMGILSVVILISILVLMFSSVFLLLIASIKNNSDLINEKDKAQLISSQKVLMNSLKVYGSDFRDNILLNENILGGNRNRTIKSSVSLLDYKDSTNVNNKYDINPSYKLKSTLDENMQSDLIDIFYTNKDYFNFYSITNKERLLFIDFSRLNKILFNQLQPLLYTGINIDVSSVPDTPVIFVENQLNNLNYNYLLWVGSYNGTFSFAKYPVFANNQTNYQLYDNIRYLITTNNSKKVILCGYFNDFDSNNNGLDLIITPSRTIGLHFVFNNSVDLACPIISESTVNNRMFDSILNNNVNLNVKYIPENYFNKLKSNFDTFPSSPLMVSVLNGDINLDQDIYLEKIIKYNTINSKKYRIINNSIDNRLNDFSYNISNESLIFELSSLRGLDIEEKAIELNIVYNNIQPSGSSVQGDVSFEYSMLGSSWQPYVPPIDTTNGLNISGNITLPSNCKYFRINNISPFNCDVTITDYKFILGKAQYPIQSILFLPNGGLTVSKQSYKNIEYVVDIYGGLFEVLPNKRTINKAQIDGDIGYTLDFSSRKCYSLNNIKYLNIPEMPISLKSFN